MMVQISFFSVLFSDFHKYLFSEQQIRYRCHDGDKEQGVDE